MKIAEQWRFMAACMNDISKTLQEKQLKKSIPTLMNLQLVNQDTNQNPRMYICKKEVNYLLSRRRVSRF